MCIRNIMYPLVNISEAAKHLDVGMVLVTDDTCSVVPVKPEIRSLFPTSQILMGHYYEDGSNVTFDATSKSADYVFVATKPEHLSRIGYRGERAFIYNTGLLTEFWQVIPVNRLLDTA